MGKYDAILSSLTTGEVIARLEGHAGLLALTSRELYCIDDKGQQSARLSGIKRITVNKETGNVDVLGEQSALMYISPSAFQKDELKLFLESLKGYVLKAKSEPTKTDESPGPRPVPPPAAIEEEPLPAPTPVPDLPPAAPVRAEPQANIVEPPRTLPEEPADSIWGYEGAPKTVEPQENLRTKPDLAPANPSNDAMMTLPPPPLAVPTPTSTQRVGFIWLKVWSLVTLAFTVGYLVVNLGSSADIWTPLGIAVFGVALAGIQWRLSEPL